MAKWGKILTEVMPDKWDKTLTDKILVVRWGKISTDQEQEVQ